MCICLSQYYRHRVHCHLLFFQVHATGQTQCAGPQHTESSSGSQLTVTSHVVLATCKQCLVCIQCNACCSSWRLRSASASMLLLTSSARVTRTCAGPQTTHYMSCGSREDHIDEKSESLRGACWRRPTDLYNCPSDRLHVLPVCPLPCTCLPISKHYFLHRVPNDRGRGRQVTNPLKEALFHWYTTPCFFSFWQDMPFSQPRYIR